MPPIVEKLLEHATGWLALSVALTYSTGYLIVTLFLARFGIPEAGVSDLLKVKYIHVGILYLLLPLGIALPIRLLYSLRKRIKMLSGDHELKQILNAYIPIGILLINVFLVFFVLIWFAPVGYVRMRAWLISSILIVATVVCLSIYRFCRQLGQRKTYFSVLLAWSVCIVAAISFYYMAIDASFAADLWGIFWGREIYPDGAIHYVFFVFLYVFILWRTNKRAREYPGPEAFGPGHPGESLKGRAEIWALGLCFAGPLYYFSILSFAIFIYPYIPVAKGGGYYEGTPSVTLHFKNSDKLSGVANKSDYLDALAATKLILIEESGTSMYLASPADAGGPAVWAEGLGYPRLLEISRDELVGAEHKR